MVADAIRSADDAVLRWLDHAAPDRVKDLAEGIDVLGSRWAWRVVRWLTIVAVLANRRIRHLVVLAAVLLGATALTTATSAPSTTVPQASRPVVMLGLSLVGAMYTLLPRGRPRNRAKLAAALVMSMLVASRLLLGIDRPSHVGLGLLVGMAIPVVAFRWFAPNEVFPIVYGRDRRPRALAPTQIDAIRAALRADHGWELCAVELLRPPGSAGSTPMRLSVRDGRGPSFEVFAKLYSLAHLRADRWYKLARAIRYGRLEDEAPFVDVRQLIEHEDYLLRLAHDAGLPVPRTYGFSEIVPGRDFLLLTEMLPDAQQLGLAPVTRDVVDQGLQIVRALWSAGLAHRDIKPANLVLSRGRLFLVDLSFGEVRPSAWREAVDLATMMLTLALVAGADVVHQRALVRFTADEIAEAFASARPVTIPAQLRACLRARDRSLPARFAAMVPARPPVAIQRWSVQRIALTAVVLAVAAILGGLLAFNLSTAGLM